MIGRGGTHQHRSGMTSEARGRTLPLDEADSPQVRTERSHSPSALDWPLSREEKKTRVLQLYDRDTRAADQLLRNGEEALDALRNELRRIRDVFPIRRDVVAKQADCDAGSDQFHSRAFSPERTPVPHPLHEANAALSRVLTDASSVLAACLANQEGPDLEVDSQKPRAKSEGQRTQHPPKSPLQRTPRRSRGGDATPKRVSFADDPLVSDEEEEQITRRLLPPPPSVPPPPPPSNPRGRLPPRPTQPCPCGHSPSGNMNIAQLSAFISGPVPQFFVNQGCN